MSQYVVHLAVHDQHACFLACPFEPSWIYVYLGLCLHPDMLSFRINILKYFQFVLSVPAFFVVEIFVLLNYDYKVYLYHDCAAVITTILLKNQRHFMSLIKPFLLPLVY